MVSESGLIRSFDIFFYQFFNMWRSKLCVFREEFGSELHGCLHVALDLEFALHEGCLRVETTVEQRHGIVVRQVESSINSANLSLLNSNLILKINSPHSRRIPLTLINFKGISKPNLLFSLFPHLFKVRLHIVKQTICLHFVDLYYLMVKK